MTRKELYLDDVAVGDEWESEEVTVTADEIIAFASQFDPQPFHTDPVAAVDTFFGGLAASGWHTASLTMRMLVTGGPKFAGGTIGGGGEISWPTPTRPGDRLHVKATVLSVDPSQSRPERGSVTMRIETLNGAGDVRQLFTVRSLLFRRPQ
jgi:acyl dehydratase